MRRWIAVFAVFALAAIVAAYMALFPLAPQGAAALRPTLERLDGTAAQAVALSSREVAVAVPLATGCVLALLLLVAGGNRKNDDEPVEVPEEDFVPVSTAFGASGQAGMRQGRRRKLVHPDPDLVWRPEPDPVAPEMEQVPGLPRSQDAALSFPPSPNLVSGDEDGGDTLVAARPEAIPTGIDLAALRPILLRRRPRKRDIDEQTWFGSVSWFGGLPRLGDQPWPRDERGALPFVAQIDLAEIAATSPDTALPASGSLAFFLGSGAVVYVPEGDFPFTEPPADLPAAYDEGGYPLPAHISRLSRLCFPYWPVTALDENDVVPARMTSYAAREPVRDFWWYGAIHLADCLHVAMEGAAHQIATEQERRENGRERLVELEADAKASPADLDEAHAALFACDSELPALENERAALAEMIAAMDGFIAGRDPWMPLAPEEIEVTEEVLRQVHRDCGRLVRFHVPQTLGELATITLRAMITGEPASLARIPEAELTRINTEYLSAVRHPHQFFGEADEQDPEHVPLLLLGYDDMIEWNWGEGGVFGFWISAENLAAGCWDRATLLFDPD